MVSDSLFEMATAIEEGIEGVERYFRDAEAGKQPYADWYDADFRARVRAVTERAHQVMCDMRKVQTELDRPPGHQRGYETN